MVKERDFQAEIVKWLRKKGCFVWKCRQDATTQAGVSDLFFCIEGFYAFLEVKKSKNSPRRPGQKEFIEKMNNWSYARMVYPEIWDEVKKEIESFL